MILTQMGTQSRCYKKIVYSLERKKKLPPDIESNERNQTLREKLGDDLWQRKPPEKKDNRIIGSKNMNRRNPPAAVSIFEEIFLSKRAGRELEIEVHLAHTSEPADDNMILQVICLHARKSGRRNNRPPRIERSERHIGVVSPDIFEILACIFSKSSVLFVIMEKGERRESNGRV